ncbi:MAG: hypothetical protein JWM40_1918 [Frankiales bacterium]|nr:hypothetical protein [Frankiales bacterium]
MTSLADRALDADHRTYAATADLLATRSDEDLTKGSGASEWTVAQVLSHLGSGAEIHLATLQAAREGEPRSADGNQAIWDQWNAMTPRQQADGFLDAGKALLSEYDDLDADERAALKVPLAYLPEPAGLDIFAGLRLNEAVLHGWDVAVAFDPAADLDQAAADVLVDLLRGPIGFLPGFTGKADQVDGHVLLAVIAGGTSFGIDIGERVQLVDQPESADGEVRLPLTAVPRLLSGRIRESDALVIEGPLTRADLLRVFSGY